MFSKLWRMLALSLILTCTGVGMAYATQDKHMQAGEEAVLKADIPQPYIVKKGDTLWDIANYFFKKPHEWLKIWENNLYISNPDLIYPGNKIWFDVKKQEKMGGLTLYRPEPTLIEKPVEKSEPPIDTSMFITALERQDFIQDTTVDGVGYIVAAESERIHFGQGDALYVKLSRAANEGDLFDVFSTSDVITDPETGDVVGVLVLHKGRVVVNSKSDGVYRATVQRSFSEMMRGDKLKPAKEVNPRIEPVYPSGNIKGKVLYIQNNGIEAGQNQIIGISLGKGNGMTAGALLSIHRQGRITADPINGDELRLPEEKVGEIMVLVPQQNASLAIIIDSKTAINLGDVIRNKVER